MSTEKLLIVESLGDEQESRDGRMYRNVGFKEVAKMIKHPITGKMTPVLSNQPTRVRPLFEKGPANKWDADGNATGWSRGDELYSKIEEGSLVAGSIDVVETEPYKINNTIKNGDVNTPGYNATQDRVANSVTVVTFDNETLTRNVSSRKDAYNQPILLKGQTTVEQATVFNQPEVVAEAAIGDEVQ